MTTASYVGSGRAPRESAEDGFTIAELLVAVMLFLILSTVLAGTFISVTRAVSMDRAIDADTRSASNGMNEVSRMVRAATANPKLNPAAGVDPNDPAVVAADARTVTLYAYVNLDSAAETPLKVSFSVNAANQLVETRWKATTLVNGHWSFSATPLTDRILTDSITPAAPIFTYLLDGGGVVPIPTGGITSATTLATIRAITISLPVETPSNQSSPVTMQTTVAMPNLGLSKTASGVTGP